AGAAPPRGVRAAVASGGPCAGRFRRGDGEDRRRRAEGPLLRARPAAQRRLLCAGLSCGGGRSLGEREDVAFDPLHYLPLTEQKINALDQAARLQGGDLPQEFATLRRLMEAPMARCAHLEEGL